MIVFKVLVRAPTILGSDWKEYQSIDPTLGILNLGSPGNGLLFPTKEAAFAVRDYIKKHYNYEGVEVHQAHLT